MKKANKTQPTSNSVDDFLKTVSPSRQAEAQVVLKIMQHISGEQPVMWGPSIIGFGSMHYKYESGREGDMPIIGFSPRKANLTLYVGSFHKMGELLDKLGKHSISVSCLYIPHLKDVDLDILTKIIEKSYEQYSMKDREQKPKTMDEYKRNYRDIALERLNELESIIDSAVSGEKLISYGVPCIKVNNKPVIYYATYRDHTSIYPVPKKLPTGAKEYIRGKGTFWFLHKNNLPSEIIKQITIQLKKERQ